MKKLSILFSILLISTLSFSQKDSTFRNPTFAIQFGHSYNSQKLVGLNTFLNNNSLPVVKKSVNHYVPLRLALTGKKMLYGIEGGFGGRDNKSNTIGQTLLTSHYYNFHLGYDISKSDKFRLFPILGYGKINNSVEMVRYTNKVINFDNIITDVDASNRKKLFASTQMLDLGLEFQSVYLRDRNSKMTIKTGYRMALNNSKWVSDYKIIGGPSDNLGSFYVHLGFSFGRNNIK